MITLEGASRLLLILFSTTNEEVKACSPGRNTRETDSNDDVSVLANSFRVRHGSGHVEVLFSGLIWNTAWIAAVQHTHKRSTRGFIHWLSLFIVTGVQATSRIGCVIIRTIIEQYMDTYTIKLLFLLAIIIVVTIYTAGIGQEAQKRGNKRMWIRHNNL